MIDLIEILETNNFSPVEIIELLDDVTPNEIEEYALKHMVCRRCYSELVLHNWKEARGECRGIPAFEEVTECICSCCGAIYPED